ncbi:MAG: response regulator [Rhodospirillaceae bacterium]
MRILIVDDHELFRNGLRFQLSTIDPEAEILEAETFEEAIQLANENGPVDKILLDLLMPGMGWREAMSSLRDRDPVPVVVVVSGADDADLVRSAMEAGASGYIPKSMKGDVLESALRLILAGGFYLTPDVYRFQPNTGASPRPAAASGRATDLPLTPRQREVLAHINAGLSNRQIAQTMNLSEATVKMHIGRLFKVLNAQSRTDALAVARRSGLL